MLLIFANKIDMLYTFQIRKNIYRFLNKIKNNRLVSRINNNKKLQLQVKSTIVLRNFFSKIKIQYICETAMYFHH